LNKIAFIDTEIDPKSGRIFDIGCITDDENTFHSPSLGDFTQFLKGAKFICGHNIFNHDLKFIDGVLDILSFDRQNIIDTLFLSPLLFPSKPYHALLKDDKLQSDEQNNPLNDAIKARDLFYDEVASFRQTDDILKKIYFLLLNSSPMFHGFFKLNEYASAYLDTTPLIQSKFKNEICSNANLEQLVTENPIELAYCLSLINASNRYSITPPWVLKKYPKVDRVMRQLRNTPCFSECPYCDNALDARLALKRFFGYSSYRLYEGEALQENAVKSAINNKSLLAVFPTGGGKSVTFQVPALMSGENTKGLTVVISPLQSLMKDQVDNLEAIGITDVVTINGLLDPIERAKSFERVEDGLAFMLYMSPESLRSKTIERLLMGRKIARFVIDEAHCLSTWGQDFRVDYLYIAEFIKAIQEKKNLDEPIPVSCFTATAKPQVIEDISSYFKNNLGLELELFSSKASRTNLYFQVFEKGNEEEKYLAAREILTNNDCPTIIYVSRTGRAEQLAERLTKDGLKAGCFHGKMEVAKKIASQDAFFLGNIKIMVATSAFGMGVNKKDIGAVIHYEISDSLENYVQEAGRAGRDETINANCYVLFNEDDLSKHFIRLNQTKITIKEIQQIWKAVKDITRFRFKVSNSALEIARKAGWDDSVAEIESRVTIAIAALEDAGYLKRGQNSPRIFANSILSKNAQEAIEKINVSERFTENQKIKAARIIKKLFSSKRRKEASDEIAESRVDYISDHLGIVKNEVIDIINLMRQENILADTKDLTAFIKYGENKKRSIDIVESFTKIERSLLGVIHEQPETFDIKELNELFEYEGCANVSPNKINTVINFWAIKNWIKRKVKPGTRNHFEAFSQQPLRILKEKFEKRRELAGFIIDFLYNKNNNKLTDASNVDEVLVEFSVKELKDAYQLHSGYHFLEIDIYDIEDTLFYLSKIEAIKIEGGFLVVYNQLTVERLEKNNNIQYKADDYQKLADYYQNKIEQIHIVGEYAKKMIDDYRGALQFVEDYFQLNYSSFLSKYFKGDRQGEIKQNLTRAKFHQLFGELSPAQLSIIKDKTCKYIVVTAGPGSGKTKVLVHKLASLLLMEDVKHDQLLMLTFSRAAATEFKKRLLKLIGNAAHFVEIKTFHSYCFDLLGKVGSLEKTDTILKKTVEKIKNKDVEINRITKTVLVIDEAQDMAIDEFELIRTLMKQNENLRLIAVGDDDQNIFEFRGANSMHLQQLMQINGALQYNLLENYRSKRNIVHFANQFAHSITQRLKNAAIIPNQMGNGKIKLVRYQSNNFLMPLVNDVVNTPRSGSVCILTPSNDEALQITGLLLKKGEKAKLIQTNDKFNLYNLAEIRSFLIFLNHDDQARVITDDVWENAKCEFDAKFKNSENWTVCKNLIVDFETINTKIKYKSDLEVFIRESKLEDFYPKGGDVIYVSTIHKAKGKEFDNVFLLLSNFNISTDEERRKIYVAITRAKQNLTIHLNSGLFDKIIVEGMEAINDPEIYEPPTQLVHQLTHEDLWLDYFIDKQKSISQLLAGDNLIVKGDGCLNQIGQPILKFSKKFQDEIEKLKSRNFELIGAKVNFVIYWQKENIPHETIIILPKLYFEKEDMNQ